MASKGNGKTKIVLYVYDISMGMARQFSQQFIGKQIDGIWHTGIVAYGYEYYYGGGIQASLPGQSMAGTPGQKINLGETSLSQSDFHEYLTGISSRFTPDTYSLLKHNCNNFTSECSQFLTGNDIPKWITGLPEEALNTPMGQPIRQMIEQQEQSMRQGMANIIPWQEDSNEYLNLPPIGGGQQPASSSSGQSTSSLKAKNEEMPCNDETKDDIPSIENINIDNPWKKTKSTSSVPAPQKAQLATSAPQHAHEALMVSAIRSHNNPLLSKDTKYKSFYALIKLASNKLKKQDPSIALTQDEISILKKSVNICSDGAPNKIEQETFVLFDRLINNWPASSMFSVLGLLRMLILRPEGHEYYSNKNISDFDPILKLIPNSQNGGDEEKELSIAPMTTQVMALRTMSNLFASSSIACKFGKEPKIVDMAMSALRSKKEKIHLMGATLLYNCSLYLPKDDSDSIVEAVSLLAELIPEETHLESCYLSLLALGHLIYKNANCALIVCELSLQPSMGNNIRADKTQQKISILYQDIQKILRYEQEEGESID